MVLISLASNAVNNKGAVFVTAVIARQTWTSEISLVGHENTEVAVYNPHIFLRNPEVLKTGVSL
jgi:protein HIRA/HIR1